MACRTNQPPGGTSRTCCCKYSFDRGTHGDRAVVDQGMQSLDIFDMNSFAGGEHIFFSAEYWNRNVYVIQTSPSYKAPGWHSQYYARPLKRAGFRPYLRYLRAKARSSWVKQKRWEKALDMPTWGLWPKFKKKCRFVGVCLRTIWTAFRDWLQHSKGPPSIVVLTLIHYQYFLLYVRQYPLVCVLLSISITKILRIHRTVQYNEYEMSKNTHYRRVRPVWKCQKYSVPPVQPVWKANILSTNQFYL